MPQYQPRDPEFADRVADAFWDGIAAHWAGELTSVLPGVVEIEVSFLDASTGGPGILHRSIVAAFLDDACQLAALSLAAAGDTVSTAEYKLNFLSQASGGELVFRAEVVRPGRSITVCRADALAGDRLVAKMLATLAVSRPQ